MGTIFQKTDSIALEEVARMRDKEKASMELQSHIARARSVKNTVDRRGEHNQLLCRI